MPDPETRENPESAGGGSGPPAEPATFEPATAADASTSGWAILALGAALVAVGLLVPTFTIGESSYFEPGPLLGIAWLFSLLAVVVGVLAIRSIAAAAGALAGKGIAITAIVLGLVHLGGFLLLPLLISLVCLMTGGAAFAFDPNFGPGCDCQGAAGGRACGCAGCGCPGGGCGNCSCPGCGACDCGCGDCGCGDCGCGDCGCGDCGCGNCGCGDCGCGGCGCGDCGGCNCGCGAVVSPRALDRVRDVLGLDEASPDQPPVDRPCREREGLAGRLDALLAHHPPNPAFDQDVYRLGDVRLCIGCFTAYPVFLVAALVLSLGAWSGPWWVWIGLGVAGGLGQVASALGLARRRAAKIVVKTGLGVGMGALLHGVLASPWAPWVQTLVLVGVVGLAALSATPRARRLEAWRARHGCRGDGTDGAARPGNA